MQKLKQGMAAITLVASLGLIVPSSFGGPASADIKPPPNDHVRNPQYVETVFHCDLNGDATTAPDDLDLYEAEYELVSTFNSTMWQDKKSNAVLVQRLRVDALSSDYTVLEPDPDGLAFSFFDDDPEWFGPPRDYAQGGGKPNGWKTVRCWSTDTNPFTPHAGDVAQEPRLVEGATYTAVDTYLYDVTIGGNGPKAKAASADDGQSADRQAKGKKGGKQKGKGKRGR